MMKRFLSVLLLGTILSCPGIAPAKNKVIEVKEGEKYVSSDDIFDIEEPTTLINNGELETTDTGNIFNMDTHPDDTINLSGSIVENHGTMKTSGTGHSVYAYPLQNQRSTTTVYNYGDMDRIELSETGKSARSSLGEGSKVFNYEGANLYGSVRLGTNATLENWGSLANKASDDKENFAYNNLIYFDKNGLLKSGFKESVVYNLEKKKYELQVDLTPSASITTDNLIFGQSSTLNNAGIIVNEKIIATDELDNKEHNGVKIYLMNNPYNEVSDVVYKDTKIDRDQAHLKYFVDRAEDTGKIKELPILITKTMSLGDKAIFRADQGSQIGADEIKIGQKANINIGADYYWLSDIYYNEDMNSIYNWNREITVEKEVIETVEVEEEVGGETVIRTKEIVSDEKKEEKRSLNPIPQRSLVSVGSLTVKDGSNIRLDNLDWNIYPYEVKEDEDGNSYGEYNENGPYLSVLSDGRIIAQNSVQLDAEGSRLFLLKSDDVAGSGNVAFGKNGILNVTGYWQEKVALSDDKTVLEPDPDNPRKLRYVESYVGDTPKESMLFVDENLTMGEGAQITLTGMETDDPMTTKGYRIIDGKIQNDAAIVIGKKMALDKNSTITLGGGSLMSTDSVDSGGETIEHDGAIIPGPGTIPGSAEIVLGDNSTIRTLDQTTNAIMAKSISFGNYGRYEASQPWDIDGDGIMDRYSTKVILADKMTFKDDGYFFNTAGGFYAKQLNMKDRAEVHIGSPMTTEVMVGTDSNVYLHPLNRKGSSNGITNGLFRQKGSTNVNLYSDAHLMNKPEDKKKIYNENYVLNGVDVDHIYIRSGGLRLGPDDSYWTDVTSEYSGDIHGTIHMATDTWVRFTGNDVKIYDPIKRMTGATNTLVWIDVDDTAVIDTRNTIDSDRVMIGGGTLNVRHKVTAPEIILDDAGALRVYDSDLVHANVHEYETTAANTTLFINPKNDVMDSFGTVQADRLYIEKGTFNARHPIVAAADGTKETREGIWLGTDTAINVYNQVHASQIIRPRSEEVGTVTNTTARLMAGSLTVDRHTDVDNLILKSGTFQFKNTGNVETEGLERDMIVTNDVTVEKGVSLLVDGTAHPNSGKVIIGDGNGMLTVNEGARLGVSNTLLAASDTPSQMNLNTHLNMKKGSILDLRASDEGSDLISSEKSINLENRVRLIVRQMKEQTDYHLMHADGGANIPDNFELSFRWHDTNFFTPNGKDVYLNVGHISTLKEELDGSGASRNIKGIGGYISDIWDGSYGPWDSIFYATTLGEAIKVIAEYVPEGYVNAPQVAMRTGVNFNNVMIAELNDMRQLSTPGAQRSRIAPSLQNRRPVYRGRSGGDSYYTRPVYQPYVRNKYQAYTPDYGNRSSFRSTGRGSYRTDKGGIWAKPFYITSTQNKNKGITGYDYDAYGLTVGLDRRFGQWTWGLSGLYAQGDFEQDNRVISSDITSWGVGIYGSFRPNKSGFFTDLYASYVQNSNKATHKIPSVNARLKANYDTTSLGAGIAFGYDLALAKSLYLTPKVGFNYARISSDDVKEKGTAPLVAKVKNPNINSMQLPVELRVAFPVMAQRFELLPELHVRYTHDFGDTEYRSKAYMNGTDTYVKLDNVGMPENWFTVGGSIGYTTGAHELSGRYDYDFGDGLTSHLFNLGYKYLF